MAVRELQRYDYRTSLLGLGPKLKLIRILLYIDPMKTQFVCFKGLDQEMPLFAYFAVTKFSDKIIFRTHVDFEKCSDLAVNLARSTIWF